MPVAVVAALSTSLEATRMVAIPTCTQSVTPLASQAYTVAAMHCAGATEVVHFTQERIIYMVATEVDTIEAAGSRAEIFIDKEHQQRRHYDF